MRVIRRISAVLIGFVFFIAGVLKLMDPVGARLVAEEYLKFLQLYFLTGASGIIGNALALLEALLGAALITGVWRKPVAIATGILQLFFTLLTVLLYVRNPRMDCGCFGEAIHLTHLQTLVKNLILVGLWVLAFVPLSKLEITRKVKYVSFPIAAVSVLLFLIYSSLSIPLMDFTPFRPGAELMLPEDIDDPTDTRTPTLPISDAAGEYRDEMLMEGNLMVVSVYDPEQVSAHSWERIRTLVRESGELGYTPMVLVASTPERLQALVSAPEILDAAMYADRKQLLTLNRSNGGASYVESGLIVTKWAFRSLPDREKLRQLIETDVTEFILAENNGDRVKFQGFLLYVFAVMLLL